MNENERKNIFIEEVERLFNENEVNETARDFFEDYKKGHSSNKKEMTERGFQIIMSMYKIDPTGLMTAKTVGEEIDLSGRSVSGSMKKLVEDGYVENYGGKPANYRLTEKGLVYATDHAEN